MAGVGPNILQSLYGSRWKHSKDNIGIWTYDDVTTKLWNITPLSKMWGIGPRMEKRLNNLKIFTIGDLARYNRYALKDKFGILGEDLWYHANGIDLTKISDLNKPPKEQSISHSQILYKDYDETNISIIIKEMVDHLTRRLRKIKKKASIIGFGINYSKAIGGGFGHTVKLDKYTGDTNEIVEICLNIFDKYYENLPIRKVSIYLSGLTDINGVQLNLFESFENIILKDKVDKAVDLIKEKYGANSL